LLNIIKFLFCGIISSLLFPPFFLFPLGFFVFPYLFYLISNNKNFTNRKINFTTLGFIYGIGLNSGILFWINEPLLLDESTRKFSYIAYLLIIYCSLFYALSFFILSFLKNNFSTLIMIPIVFVLAEILRENLFFGFPWVSFASVALVNNKISNLAFYFGTYGLSYCLLIFFLVPSLLIFLFKKQFILYSKIYLSCILAIIFFSTTLLIIRFFDTENNNLNKISISLNQLNISQLNRTNADEVEKRLELIKQTISDNPSDLVVFSENDFPQIVTKNVDIEQYQTLLKDNQTVILGGIRKENSKYYNSLFKINKKSYSYFDKKILVPFGEFLPFRKYLNFLDVIVGDNDFEKGKKIRHMNLNSSIGFLPVICYEIIFFNYLLDENNFKDPLMINITNDAWFGSLSGPYQHLYHSILRSIEFNKFLIRVSNNGVSVVVNNYGKVINQIPLNTKGKINMDINIPDDLYNYTKFHKLIYLVLLIIFVISLSINKKNE